MSEKDLHPGKGLRQGCAGFSSFWPFRPKKPERSGAQSSPARREAPK